MKKILFLSLILAFAACQSEVLDNSMLVEAENVSFAEDVLPILRVSCNGADCHIGSSSVNGVNLNTYQNVISSIGQGYNGPIVIAGNASDSPLIDKLGTRPRFGIQMPDGKPPLSTAEVALIRAWIDEGALDN